MISNVTLEARADFDTMKRMERKMKEVYSITQAIILTDHQKSILYKKIRVRFMVITFVINSNHNKYGRFKEDCNNSYNHQNNHKWPSTAE